MLSNTAWRHGPTVAKYVVAARLEPARAGMSELVLTVSDSGNGATPLEMAHGRALGVGLQNVERRLTHQYGAAASLTVDSIPDRGTTVTIRCRFLSVA